MSGVTLPKLPGHITLSGIPAPRNRDPLTPYNLPGFMRHAAARIASKNMMPWGDRPAWLRPRRFAMLSALEVLEAHSLAHDGWLACAGTCWVRLPERRRVVFVFVGPQPRTVAALVSLATMLGVRAEVAPVSYGFGVYLLPRGCAYKPTPRPVPPATPQPVALAVVAPAIATPKPQIVVPAPVATVADIERLADLLVPVLILESPAHWNPLAVGIASTAKTGLLPRPFRDTLRPVVLAALRDYHRQGWTLPRLHAAFTYEHLREYAEREGVVIP